MSDENVKVVVASDEEIKESGVTQAPPLSFDAEPLKPIEATHSLADISKERVLFTHAPLMVHAGMNPDPLLAFLAEYKVNSPVTLLRTPVKLFSGLALRDANDRVIDDSWESLLFAIDKQDFPALYRFFSNIAAIDRLSNTVIMTLTQRIPVLDVVAICNKGVDRREKVTIFTVGLNTNRGRIYFVPPRVTSLMNRVTVKVDNEVEPSVGRVAKALLLEHSQPLAGDEVTTGKTEVIADPTELVTAEVTA